MTSVNAAGTQPSFTFEGVVRLTRIGVSYVVFTIALGFAALNTGNNALYIALTFMLGCLLLSGIASKGGLKHLRVEFVSVDDAWAGRPAQGVLRITNSSAIWNVRDVVITSSELGQPAFISILPRKAAVEAPATFLFARRGVVQLKRIDLYTRYPFGFFLKKRRVPIQGEVVVFPRLRGDDTPRERFRPVSGDLTSVNRPGAGSEIHSFREYVAGDSLRQVAWKKSASIGRWIVKQPELEASRAVHVVVDPYKPHGVDDETFEAMISDAATYLYHAVNRGLDVMLSLPRVTVRAQPGESASSIFRALALVDAAHERVDQPVDRSSVVFTVARDTKGGADDAASA